jgi:hypothetical protein
VTQPVDEASAADAPTNAPDAEGGAADAQPTLAPTPPMGATLQGLTLFDGWEDPRALAAPVDSIGWEDCAYISASGARLYFGYTQFDYVALRGGSLVADGPLRPGEIRAGFEIYEATIEDGGWVVAPSSANSSDLTISEAAEGVDDSETTMAFIRYDSAPSAGDIYLTKKAVGGWGPAEKLPSPINSACVEDNAAISRDGTQLYFDSNRADDLGTTCKPTSGIETRTIYVSTLGGGSWSAPVPVRGAPNGGLFHWQVYPREDPRLYWVGHDTDCAADICVYRADRDADGGYEDAHVVVQPTPGATAKEGDVDAIGEVSITRDGHWMYFVYIAKATSPDGGEAANLDIGVVHRP